MLFRSGLPIGNPFLMKQLCCLLQLSTLQSNTISAALIRQHPWCTLQRAGNSLFPQQNLPSLGRCDRAECDHAKIHNKNLPGQPMPGRSFWFISLPLEGKVDFSSVKAEEKDGWGVTASSHRLKPNPPHQSKIRDFCQLLLKEKPCVFLLNILQ